MEKLLLTVAEAAEVLNVSKNRVYELIYSEQVRSIRIGHRHRVPVSAIEEFIEGAAHPDSAA
ncbi:MAG: helix-turn-helix domain-containing protein [Propionibacteriales bacterium]|nr:helix-turn-helix domain-containing protein [Propionibacteriales bacterium]HEV8176863.1 helix-turn-helix domain-containing protein [Gemmatimonadales bacterium]